MDFHIFLLLLLLLDSPKCCSMIRNNYCLNFMSFSRFALEFVSSSEMFQERALTI